MMILDRYKRESQLLIESGGGDKGSEGFSVVVIKVFASQGAVSLIKNFKSMLVLIDDIAMAGEWPNDTQWESLLPKWFIDASLPNMTEQQANSWLIKWKKMSKEERAKTEEDQPWALDSWTHWMAPANRQWFYVASNFINYEEIEISVEVESWPFPWGSLKWLLKASGATSISMSE